MEHDQGIGVYRWRYSASSSVNIEDISAFCSVIIACCSVWVLMRVSIMALRSASSEVCWLGVLAVAATSLAGAGCRVVPGGCGNMQLGLMQVPVLAKVGQSGRRSERPLCYGGCSKAQGALLHSP